MSLGNLKLSPYTIMLAFSKINAIYYLDSDGLVQGFDKINILNGL
jgi:hypothetical protein